MDEMDVDRMAGGVPRISPLIVSLQHRPADFEAAGHRTGARVRTGDPGVEQNVLVWPTFDEQGRITRKDTLITATGMSAVMDMDYDDMGNLATLVYPSGIVVEYAYGAATNLLEQVSVDLGGGPVTLAQNLRHNPAGGLSACTYGNGVTLAITPDVRNRPEDWVVSIGMDDLVNNQYAYDAFGNITDLLRWLLCMCSVSRI